MIWNATTWYLSLITFVCLQPPLTTSTPSNTPRQIFFYVFCRYQALIQTPPDFNFSRQLLCRSHWIPPNACSIVHYRRWWILKCGIVTPRNTAPCVSVMGNVSARAPGIIQPTADAQTDSGVHGDEKFPKRQNFPGLVIFVLNISFGAKIFQELHRMSWVFLKCLQYPDWTITCK